MLQSSYWSLVVLVVLGSGFILSHMNKYGPETKYFVGSSWQTNKFCDLCATRKMRTGFSNVRTTYLSLTASTPNTHWAHMSHKKNKTPFVRLISQNEMWLCDWVCTQSLTIQSCLFVQALDSQIGPMVPPAIAVSISMTDS